MVLHHKHPKLFDSHKLWLCWTEQQTTRMEVKSSDYKSNRVSQIQ